MPKNHKKFSRPDKPLAKCPTGIPGLAEITSTVIPQLDALFGGQGYSCGSAARVTGGSDADKTSVTQDTKFYLMLLLAESESWGSAANCKALLRPGG